ncbi:MAG: helix-turn-helix domain-containing protein [Burkholderiales bacterium]
MNPSDPHLLDPSAKRQELLALAERVSGAWVGMKVAALLLLLEGQRPAWIAGVLGLTRISLRRWVHSVNELGVESLVPRPGPGRPAALTPKLRHELASHLERSPQEFGLDGTHWNGQTLVVHLKRRFGISLKVRQAQNWMRQLNYGMKGAGHAGSEQANCAPCSVRETGIL